MEKSEFSFYMYYVYERGKMMKRGMKWCFCLLIVFICISTKKPATSVNAKWSISSHKHVASKIWSKDSIYHWHTCIKKDGGKLKVATHTFGRWIIDKKETDITVGIKHRDCTVCGQVQIMTIPARTSIIIEASHQIHNGKDIYCK